MFFSLKLKLVDIVRCETFEKMYDINKCVLINWSKSKKRVKISINYLLHNWCVDTNLTSHSSILTIWAEITNTVSGSRLLDQIKLIWRINWEIIWIIMGLSVHSVSALSQQPSSGYSVHVVCSHGLLSCVRISEGVQSGSNLQEVESK